MVIHSPIARDTVLVRNVHTGLFERKCKLILQCSIRELHCDLYKPSPVGLRSLVVVNGKNLVSDTMFRSLLPPELRKMTNYYQEMCLCEICHAIYNLQSSLNRYRTKQLLQMKDWTDLAESTPYQKIIKAKAKLAYLEYQADGFDVEDKPLHPKARDAVASIQCDSPVGFEGTGIVKFECAAGLCPDCPSFQWPKAETIFNTEICFYCYKNLPTCSRCGAMPNGTTECQFCLKKKDKRDRGKFSSRKHMALERLLFLDFRLKYERDLIKFKFHLFKSLTLGKVFTTDVRRRSLQQGEVSIHHDFTEALHVKHNEEIQSKHFGGGVTVSIEGYTVHYPNFMDGSSLVFDFHSFLSDDKTQMAKTVHWHMDQVISTLMEKHILVPGGRLLSGTDGCAKQYRCANAVYFLSVLATKYNIVVDRSISCSGHGKNEVDAINGVDKNTIYRRSMRKHVPAADAMQSDNKCMKAHSFSSVAGDSYSAAEDCKRVLENEGSEGVKSEGKRAKRESERGISNRYWHVRKIEDKLNNVRCETIKNFSKTCTFMDMYHYYTCPELKIGFAALRRHPCNCTACDETIRTPWDNSKAAKDQGRFVTPEGCYFRTVFGDHNCWYIVEVKPGADTDEEDLTDIFKDVLHHVTSAVAASVELGNIGAIATDDESSDGYYLVEFTGVPYTEQSGSSAGALMCECYWLYPIPGARKWYTRSEVSHIADLTNVVDAAVVMNPVSPSNMVPAGPRRNLDGLIAVKISEESHNFILDEVQRRERLEYDPSRVYTEDGNNDSDSED